MKHLLITIAALFLGISVARAQEPADGLVLEENSGGNTMRYRLMRKAE